jgi:hypothetical protein
VQVGREKTRAGLAALRKGGLYDPINAKSAGWEENKRLLANLPKSVVLYGGIRYPRIDFVKYIQSENTKLK